MANYKQATIILGVLLVIAAGAAAYVASNPTTVVKTVTATQTVQGSGATVTVTKTAVEDRDTVILKAAEAEGSLIIYNVDTAFPKVIDAFEKKYPSIKVQRVSGSYNDVANKARAEFDSKVYNADIYQVYSPLSGMLQRGALDRTYISPNAEKVPEMMIPIPDGILYYYKQDVRAPAYNADLVKKDIGDKQTLQTLVTDPQWKGRIGMVDPSLGGAGTRAIIGLSYILKDKWEDWLTALVKQKPVLYGDEPIPRDALAKGEISWWLDATTEKIQKLRESGVKVEQLWSEPRWSSASDVAIARQAKHPNAAKLFIDFMTSPDGAQAAVNAGVIPFRKDVQLQEWMSKSIPSLLVRPDHDTSKQQFIDVWNRIVRTAGA